MTSKGTPKSVSGKTPSGEVMQTNLVTKIRKFTPEDPEKWLVCLHEAGHLVVASKLFCDCSVYASVAWHPVKCGWTGFCVYGSVNTLGLSHAVFVASGKEAERYTSIQGHRYAATMSPSTPCSTDDGCPIASLVAKEFHNTLDVVDGIESDNVIIGKCIIATYPEYSDVRQWPGIHRRIRARARFILMRNKDMLISVASRLYKDNFHLHDQHRCAVYVEM